MTGGGVGSCVCKPPVGDSDGGRERARGVDGSAAGHRPAPAPSRRLKVHARASGRAVSSVDGVLIARGRATAASQRRRSREQVKCSAGRRNLFVGLRIGWRGGTAVARRRRTGQAPTATPSTAVDIDGSIAWTCRRLSIRPVGDRSHLDV